MKTNLKKLCQKIVELEDLKPSSKVNSLFTELVQSAINSDKDLINVITNDELKNLQKICAESEFELEKYWTNKLLNQTDSQISDFPYYKNYKDLTRLEYYSLLACGVPARHKPLFIGGGPLPLTAIVLAQDYDVVNTVLEPDPDAYMLSKQLIKKLNLQTKIKIINSRGEDFNCYNEYDVIYIAALAGIEKEIKEKIFTKITETTKNNIHVLARSSWGNRRILYKPIDLRKIVKLKPTLEIHPHNEIVNSVIIFEK
jgi:nicotianamine synthase